jgi:hypothetical protein
MSCATCLGQPLTTAPCDRSSERAVGRDRAEHADESGDHPTASPHDRRGQLAHAVVETVEAPVDLVKPPVDLLKALIDLLKAPVDLLEPLIDLLEPPVDMPHQVVEALVCPGGSLH